VGRYATDSTARPQVVENLRSRTVRGMLDSRLMMSNKARSIARSIQRRRNVAPTDEYLLDMVQDELSTELHLCPTCREARIAPPCCERWATGDGSSSSSGDRD